MTEYLTIKEIRELSRRSKLKLFGEDTHFDKNSHYGEEKESAITSLGTFSNLASPMNYSNSSIGVENANRGNKRLDNAFKIMKAQVDHEYPFLFRNEAASIAGVKGGATLLQAEDEAFRKGLIKKHQIARAKTRKCLWEITDSGYERMNCKRNLWKSKGEYIHKFCAYRIGNTYLRQGFKATIEYRLCNGKLIDLHLKKDGIITFVEICASNPVRKELSNIIKDLDGEPLPENIIIAITERAMKKKLEMVLDEYRGGKSLIRPVEVRLAGDLIDGIEMR